MIADPGIWAELPVEFPAGDPLASLDRLEELFSERGAEVLRYRKPTYTKPAPVALRQEIAARSDAVVVALAD